MLKEFKEFALKGNMIDMAVGIIMGAAFGTIVNSLVNDVIMPPIGALTGGLDFSQMKIPVKAAVMAADGVTIAKPAIDIAIGKFINAMISFGIIAWVMFMLIKGMNNMKKKEAAAPPPPPARQEVLLEEIRNLLAKGR